MSCSCSGRQPVCHRHQVPCLSPTQVQASPCLSHSSPSHPSPATIERGYHHHAHHHTPPSHPPNYVTCTGCTPTSHTHQHQYRHTHPSPVVPSPLCISSHRLHVPPGPSPMAVVRPHVQKMDPLPIPLSNSSQQLTSFTLPPPSSPSHGHQEARHTPNPRVQLETSPLSRPHPPHRQLRTHRPHPQYGDPRVSPSKGVFNFPSLEFSPANVADVMPPPSSTFQLGVTEIDRGGEMKEDSTEDPHQLPPDDTINYGAVSGEAVASKLDKTEPQKEVLPTSLTQTAPPTASDTPPTTSDAPPTEVVAKTIKNPILLYKWSFKLMANDMVVLLGYKSQSDDELKWRSGPISERISPSLLMTKSGQLYHLMGHLNSEELLKDSPHMTKQLLRKFKRGFPSKWVELLKRCDSSDVAIVKETSKPKGRRSKSTKNARLPATSSLPDLTRVKKEKEAESGRTVMRMIKQEVVEDERLKTPEVSTTMDTPASTFVNSLKRSSRGRVIKPAQTTMTSSFQSCSDLYSYDWHGNFTGVSTVIDLTCDDDPLPKSRRHRRIIKKEPMDESTANDLNTTADCTIGPASTSNKPVQVKKTGGESSKDVPAAPRPVVKKGKKRGTISRKLYCEDLEETGGSESEAGQQIEPQRRNSDSETADLRVGGQQVEAQRKKSDSRSSSRGSEGETEEGVRENTSHGPGKKNKGRYLSDSESEHGQHPVKRHAHQTRRRRAARVMISDDSEVELEHRTTRQGQRSPARRQRTAASSSTHDEADAEPIIGFRLHPKAESHHRGKKISESSTLDMSDVALSSRSVKAEGKRMRYDIRTLSSGGGDEILTHVVDKKSELSDKDLLRLTYIVRGVPAATSNFWEAVSRRLGTGHSANQCCSAYLKLTEKQLPQTPDKRIEGGVASSPGLGGEIKIKTEKQSLSKGAPPPPAQAKKGESLVPPRAEIASGKSEKAQKVTETSVLENMSLLEKSTSHGVRKLTSHGIGKTTGHGVRKKEKGKSQYRVRLLAAGGGQEILGDTEPVDQPEISLRELRQIVHGVPALTSNFWEVVARRLGTGHTAHQCSTAYHGQRNKMKPPTSRPRKRGKDKVASETTITAKAGTLKRKRQLRDVLENLDSGYVDDIFDSTPFKKIRKSVQIPETHDDYFDDEENVPRSLHTPSHAHARVGAPLTHTPRLCDYLTTPDFRSGLTRNVADHVIYKAQKANKATKKVTFRQPSSSKSLICEQRLRNIRTGELTTLRMFEDSDDCSSDETNPFDDM